MTFLAPFLLVGLASLAIPVFVHLVQRERRRVVPFPSLMFLRRIPYKSVRRRRIRDLLLLAVRLAALLLIVLAFARPFFPRGALAKAAASGGREVVILLDRSASMAYGDHWSRASAAAQNVVAHLGSGDRATLVALDSGAEERVRATGDRARLDQAIAALAPGAGATRYAPALKLAMSVLARSPLQRREAVLISDLQKGGWRGGEDVRFPEGTGLTIVRVGGGETPNLSVASVSIARALFAGKERVTLTVALRNNGAASVENVPVSLQIGDEVVQTVPATVAGHASAAVAFAPFTLGTPGMAATVRAGTDPLPADNVFRLVLAPSPTLKVLLVEPEGGDPLYLRNALSIGTAPAFQVETSPPSGVTAATLAGPSLVVLDGVPAGRVGASMLVHYVEQGGGLLMVGGSGAVATALSPPGDPLPSMTAGDRDEAATTSIGYVDYSHPVFEIFQGAHAGDFTGTHVYRYRALAVGKGDRVLARFSDGAVAALERRVGRGRVIAWSSTLDDSWNDLAVRPVFLPFVQQIGRYLARYEPQPSWRTVGDAVDPATVTGSGVGGAATRTADDRLVVAPSGRRIDGCGFVDLDEQGFYEIRRPGSAPTRVAVNLDPAESDLAAMNPEELAAAVTGHARPTAGETSSLSRDELERRQSIWWDLLFGGLVLLGLDTWLGTRASGPGVGRGFAFTKGSGGVLERDRHADASTVPAKTPPDPSHAHVAR